MKLGKFQLHLISDGNLWLDGGAMFGVVPKVMWKKKVSSDEKNRVCLGLNCLLIQTGKENILIDTGCGDKYSDKEIQIFGIEHPTDILRELRRFKVFPEEVDWVINTHYHFDHCGGNTRFDKDEVVPTFPNATYVVREKEYLDASHANERTQASYFDHNWKPVERRGMLRLIKKDEEIVRGVTLVGTPGHTAGHQSVQISSEGRTLFYIADLCPTAVHIPLPWIMGFDVFPLTTLQTRKKIYHQAVEEEWLLFFEHDTNTPMGYLRRKEGKYILQPELWEE